MNEFIKAMQFRHACKLFDDKKRISKKDFGTIIEAARLSPSSFGLEPWHFLVIENAKVKEALRPACCDQAQVTTSSHLVVLLARKAKFFKKGSEYLDEAFERQIADKKLQKEIKKEFDDFLRRDLDSDVKSWAKAQTYIAGANLMTSAAFIGIDSCPLEGFNAKAFKKALVKNVPAFDKKTYEVAFAIAFGYRANEAGEKIRLPLGKIATFVK